MAKKTTKKAPAKKSLLAKAKEAVGIEDTTVETPAVEATTEEAVKTDESFAATTDTRQMLTEAPADDMAAIIARRRRGR